MKKVTLEDGSEIEYTELNWNQQAEIVDMHQEMYAKGLPISLQLCSKIMIYTKVCTPIDLNDKKYSIEEVYNIGSLLIAETLQPLLDKKK